MCALIGHQREPAGQRHSSARTSSSQCLRHRVRCIIQRAASSSRAAGSRPACHDGQRGSSAAAEYIVGQAGTAETLQGRRWEPGRPPTERLLWTRLLSFDSECCRSSWSCSTQSVAMASDPSPATSGSAAAQLAGGHSTPSIAVQQFCSSKSCCRITGKQPAALFAKQGIKTESTSSERCEHTVSPVRRHAP